MEEASLDGVRTDRAPPDSATHVFALEKDQTYEFDGIAIEPSSDKNGVAFKWAKGAAKKKITTSDTCLRSDDVKNEMKMLPRLAATVPLLDLFGDSFNIGEHCTNGRG